MTGAQCRPAPFFRSSQRTYFSETVYGISLAPIFPMGLRRVDNVRASMTLVFIVFPIRRTLSTLPLKQ